MKPDIAFGDFFDFAATANPQEILELISSEVYKDSLIKSKEFLRFKNLISSYIYSLLRSLEFESCWLISCKDIDFKILLGEKIGFDARCLDALHSRMFEKLAFRYLPTANAAYAKNFANSVNLKDEREIASFLYSLSQDFYENIQAYLTDADPTDDEPTYLTLTNIKSELVSQIEKLKKWSRKDFPVESLSSTSEDICCYSGKEEIPAIANFPGRPSNLSFSEASIVTHKSYADLMSDSEKLRRFSHYVYIDVEVAAMEVCAKNIVSDQQMPLDFKLDLARQIWDAVSLINATLSSNVEINRVARRISDFPDAFVDVIEENNKVYGYRKS